MDSFSLSSSSCLAGFFYIDHVYVCVCNSTTNAYNILLVYNTVYSLFLLLYVFFLIYQMMIKDNVQLTPIQWNESSNTQAKQTNKQTLHYTHILNIFFFSFASHILISNHRIQSYEWILFDASSSSSSNVMWTILLFFSFSYFSKDAVFFLYVLFPFVCSVCSFRICFVCLLLLLLLWIEMCT